MKPVPQLRIPPGPGARLLTGKALNRLVEALNARTPLNSAANNDKGFQGVAGNGGATRPGPVSERFDEGKVYFVRPAFSARFAAQLAERSPRTVTLDTPHSTTHPKAPKATGKGLNEAVRSLSRVTPRRTVFCGSSGYRMPWGDKTARLQWEINTRVGLARICTLGESVPDPGNFVTQTTQTDVFENGSFDYVVTAPGGITSYEEGEEPTECAAAIIEDGRDYEFDYGDFVSSSIVEVTVPFSDLVAEAILVAEDADPTPDFGSLEWPESAWKATSDADLPSPVLLGAGSVSPYEVDSVFRASIAEPTLKNRGGCALKLDWLLVNSATLAEIDSDSITLPPGASATIPLPTVSYGEPMALTLTRVRMGRYLRAS